MQLGHPILHKSQMHPGCHARNRPPLRQRPQVRELIPKKMGHPTLEKMGNPTSLQLQMRQHQPVVTFKSQMRLLLKRTASFGRTTDESLVSQVLGRFQMRALKHIRDWLRRARQGTKRAPRSVQEDGSQSTWTRTERKPRISCIVLMRIRSCADMAIQPVMKSRTCTKGNS